MDDDSSFSQRRLPAVEKKISEVDNQSARVRVTGTIIDKKDNMVMVDDGSGKIKAVFSEPVPQETQEQVRVFGRVMPSDEGFEIQGELIQSMEGVDMKTYRKVREMERDLG